jgi:hypothetical protein
MKCQHDGYSAASAATIVITFTQPISFRPSPILPFMTGMESPIRIELIPDFPVPIQISYRFSLLREPLKKNKRSENRLNLRP